jgi:uncharacterized Zn finger protein (UPF0148 family)
MPLPFTCSDCGVRGFVQYTGAKPKDVQCPRCHEKRVKALGEKQVEKYHATIEELNLDIKELRGENLELQRRFGRAMKYIRDSWEYGDGSAFDEIKKRIMEGE